MTNQEIIEKVNQWQRCFLVHPLTCGNNSQHQRLIPKEEDTKVILVCLDCNYIQDDIPSLVLFPNIIERIRETAGLGSC